jgi:hypothetical protein
VQSVEQKSTIEHTEKMAEHEHRTARRAFRGVSEEWQQFWICVLFHFLLPLLPLFALWFMDQHVSEHEFLLTAAIYTFAIGTSSRSKLIFALSIVFAILFTMACGRQNATNGAIPFPERILSGIAFLAVIVPHILERYNRHVVFHAPYLEF